MDDLVIRDARPGDLSAVAALRWKWSSGKAGTSDLSEEDFERAFVEWAEDHHESHRCAVAVERHQVIGMAWLAVLSRVPTAGAVQRAAGDIQSVYVLPEHRDRGVGTRLIAHLLGRAQALGLERVTVHSSGEAVPTYLRSGFTTSERFLQFHPPAL